MNENLELTILNHVKNNREVWSDCISDCECLSLMPRHRYSDSSFLRYHLVFEADFLFDFSEVARRGLDQDRVFTMTESPFLYQICFVNYNRVSKEITFEEVPQQS